MDWISRKVWRGLVCQIMVATLSNFRFNLLITYTTRFYSGNRRINVFERINNRLESSAVNRDIRITLGNCVNFIMELYGFHIFVYTKEVL